MARAVEEFTQSTPPARRLGPVRFRVRVPSTMRNRRGCRIVAACLLIAPATVQAQPMIVTLLGTGGPEPAVDRFGPATLVQAGATKLVFDAGRGVSQRLWQLGVRPGEITRRCAALRVELRSRHVRKRGCSDPRESPAAV